MPEERSIKDGEIEITAGIGEKGGAGGDYPQQKEGERKRCDLGIDEFLGGKKKAIKNL